MSKILVVEDELFLQKKLRELLEKYGYQVLTASGVSEALYHVQNSPAIDLFLLDVWLPDGDGFELCSRIRRRSMKPILFLTACGDEESVVRGLNIGGDDYIAKPFRTGELISRIQANLRRQTVFRGVKIRKSGEIRLDQAQGRVYKDEEELELGSAEYHLLLILMENAGRIVKREQLLEKLWDDSGKYVEDNTLSVSMSRLRRKIGGAYIETIRGFGYRFTKPVEEYLE
jgi:DNA-binding response OmpR family regulator